MSELTFTKSFLSALDTKPQKLPADHVYDLRTFQPRMPYTLPKLPNPPHPVLSKPTRPPAPPGAEPAKQQQQQRPSQKTATTIHLKSARNPHLHLTLPGLSIHQTTVLNLKQAVHDHLSTEIPLEKIKILHHRKPLSSDAGRTVGEVLAAAAAPGVIIRDTPMKDAGDDDDGGKEKDTTTTVEFGVMVMGGAGLKEGIPITGTPITHTISTATTVEDSEGAAAAASGRMAMEDVVVSGRGEAAPRREGGGGPVGEEVLATEEFWLDLRGYLMQRLKVDEEMAGKVANTWRRAWKGMPEE